jgi:hypothetical protein
MIMNIYIYIKNTRFCLSLAKQMVMMTSVPAISSHKQVHMFTSTINDSDIEQLRGFKKAGGGTVSKMTQRHAFFGWDPMTPRAVGRVEVAANGGAFWQLHWDSIARCVSHRESGFQSF